MIVGNSARVIIEDGAVYVTMVCRIDGEDVSVTAPIGNGRYFATRAVECAFDFAAKQAVEMADATLADENRDGGLISRDSLHRAQSVKLAMGGE